MHAFRPASVSEYIKQARLKAGLTQAALAKTLGYKPQFIANWERGASSPPVHILAKLVKALGLNPDDLVKLLVEESKNYWTSWIQAKKGKPARKSKSA